MPPPHYPRKQHETGWATAGLESFGEEKISCNCQDTNPGPTASSYTDYALPDPLYTDGNIYILKMTKIQDRSNHGTSDGLLNYYDVANIQLKSLPALRELTVTVTHKCYGGG